MRSLSLQLRLIFRTDDDPSFASSSTDPLPQSHFSKFEEFISRASACKNVLLTQKLNKSTTKRRIVLLEELPNILHAGTRAQFHETLQNLVNMDASHTDPVPIVIIVSDSGMRGEASDERMSNGHWGRDNDGVVDIRTVLSKELLHSAYVTQIRFNPIAPTLLKKALQALLTKHFSSSPLPAPSKETVDIVVESCNGDIRSAVMALQFACVADPWDKKRKGKKVPTRVVLESVTRREQSLALFHLMGKVLYNKRKCLFRSIVLSRLLTRLISLGKGDQPNSSLSTKEVAKERELDAKLKEPPELPSHLQEHHRRASRVDVDVSPILSNTPRGC